MLEDALGWIRGQVQAGLAARVTYLDGVKDEALVQYPDRSSEAE
jgi:hypothetical protein